MRMLFKVAPNYTVAYHGTQCLPEWTGKSLVEFTVAMGRPHDAIESYTIAGRSIKEYIWN